jgi:hypothetical protein
MRRCVMKRESKEASVLTGRFLGDKGGEQPVKSRAGQEFCVEEKQSDTVSGQSRYAVNGRKGVVNSAISKSVWVAQANGGSAAASFLQQRSTPGGRLCLGMQQMRSDR